MDKQIIDILNTLFNLDLISSDDIPNIELYMDQVTTFMEKHLGANKRYKEDKIMTKTMINNYTKNQLLPASNKKKYSKEHIFLLILIYYYKNVLSISDIQNLLSPLSQNYFPKNEENGLSLEDIFTDLMEQLNDSKLDIRTQILSSLENSKELFEEKKISDSDKDELSRFVLVSQLCYDIYLRKQLIERLLDATYGSGSIDKKRKK